MIQAAHVKKILQEQLTVIISNIKASLTTSLQTFINNT